MHESAVQLQKKGRMRNDYKHVQERMTTYKTNHEVNKMDTTTRLKEDQQIGETNWLEAEDESLKGKFEPGDKLPSVQFAENKITLIKVDATNKFPEWDDKQKGIVKSIIPCWCMIDNKEVKYNWWLNKKNPVYKEVIRTCRDASDKSCVRIQVLQTGTKKDTKYIIVK